MNTTTEPGLVIHPPSAEEIAAIDRDGFVVLRGVIDPEWRAALGAQIDALVMEEGERAGLEVHREQGTDRLANLVNKGGVFDAVWTHPRLLGLVVHILGRPFSLSSLNAREPKPGQGHQRLHADWADQRSDDLYHVANSLWVLDGMDAGNGGTRLVPGTHRMNGPISDPHPQEIVPTIAAGDVVVLNSHCRHGGTVNVSGRRRRVIHCSYIGAEHQQQCDFPNLVSSATLARLTPAQRALLRCG